MTRQITFPTSERDPTGDGDNPDKGQGPGPGAYAYGHCYDHLSEKATHQAGRFPRSQRQGMAMRTPSPGAVYNLGKTCVLIYLDRSRWTCHPLTSSPPFAQVLERSFEDPAYQVQPGPTAANAPRISYGRRGDAVAIAATDAVGACACGLRNLRSLLILETLFHLLQVTIASRIPRREPMGAGPGKIYNAQVRSASPSYSFGRGQKRFSTVNFLPELD